MGFLYAIDAALPINVKQQREDAVLHRLGCKVCELAKVKNNRSPDMQPRGVAKPVVYMLGEAPGGEEDDEGKPFVGPSGQFLSRFIPYKWEDRLRWSNVVRTRPPRNRNPERAEIECCRPSVVADIEQAQPRAIFGFGNIPLNWVSGFSGIMVWRGRRMPVQIGEHVCWYYPMLHPAYILRRLDEGYGVEDERMFRLDLQHAFAEVESLPPPQPHSPVLARTGIELITDYSDAGLRRIEQLLKRMLKVPAVGIDYETSCLRPYEPGATLLSTAVSTGEWTVAFPFDHREARWSPERRTALARIWSDFLRNYPGVKAVHNLAFELEWTAVNFSADLVRTGTWEDSASQAAVLDERVGKMKPGCFSLEFLVQQHFGFNIKKLSPLDRTALATTPLPPVLVYNGLDAKYHVYLWRVQAVEIVKHKLQEPYRLARRRVPTVVLSQIKGVPIDQQVAKVFHDDYAKRITTIEAEIAQQEIIKRFEKEQRHKFNPLSNPDAIKLFHKMLRCSECEVEDKYTHLPKLSVDETVLQQIAERHEVAAQLIALRKISKRKATYTDPLIEGSSVLYPDGLLHATFNTLFAETGRLSCDGPNLQNIPKRSEEAREIRRAFVSPEGHVIVAIDYGQIEARVIAMFTHDARFCKALWERYDVHMEWAERISRVYPERVGGRKNFGDKKVMKAFRTDIKNQWTFPLFFGARLASVAGYLNIPEDVLEPVFDDFWEEFSGVHDWQRTLLSFYRKHGYVECLTGRRRRGPLSSNQVYNSPIQGTAAEIVLDAMARLSETGDPELQPELNIHDDLTWMRVPEDRIEQHVDRAVKMMLDVPFDWVNVPITVEVSIGTNWCDMEEVATFSSDQWSVG